MKKKLKKMLYVVLGVIIFFVGGYFLVVNVHPDFGAKINENTQLKYISSKEFKNGVFHNKINVFKDQGVSSIFKMIKMFAITKTEDTRPNHDLKVFKLDSAKIAAYTGPARLFWYGHSAFLLQIDNKNILLDPMFGDVASPFTWIGGHRFNKELPLEIAKLPKIDAIVFSHDHYDHLDYESVMKLKSKTEHYFVPLGVGEHLTTWGVSAEKITELDWWEIANFKDIKFILTPSQHFSGRRMDNRMSTLWGSWVIKSANANIFFSGDGGYNDSFKKIGEKYGPFDIALIECGQYNKMWANIHMMPEESAQAGVDVKAKKMIPIHWAGFKLALHSWRDPIIRVLKKSKELGLPLVTPQIGEEVIIKDSVKVYKNWWN